jgi:hypothetical protein
VSTPTGPHRSDLRIADNGQPLAWRRNRVAQRLLGDRL